MYERSITKSLRTAFVILIDQSGSMAGLVEYEGRRITKAEAVAEVTNKIIGELIERARRQEGIRDYYDIVVCGYSGDGVTPLLSADIKNPSQTICELAAREVKVHTRLVDRITPKDGSRISFPVNYPMWVEPKATGETPMYESLCFTFDFLSRWIADPKNADSFPPMVFNISDGDSTDCSAEDMINISRKIKSLATSDGEVLLLNIHISSSESEESIIFPTLAEVERMKNKSSQNLAYSSSILPKDFDKIIGEHRGARGETNFVGMSYNSSIEELLTILNIGTISVKRG